MDENSTHGTIDRTVDWLSIADAVARYVMIAAAVVVVMLSGVGALAIGGAVVGTAPVQSDYCLADSELQSQCPDIVVIESPMIEGGAATLTGELRSNETFVPLDTYGISDNAYACLMDRGARGFRDDGADQLYATVFALQACAS